MTRQGNPTGPKPGFTRQEVVAAALEIGIDRFTLAAVAQRLGVATSALYRTISSREDLLRACLERVAAATDFSDLSGPWQRVAHGYAEHLWALLEEQPGLAGVLVSTSWAYQFFARPISEAQRALTRGGLSPDDAVLALDFIADTVISVHLQTEVARAPVGDASGISPKASGGRTEGEGGADGPSGLEVARRRFAEDGRAAQLPAALAPSSAWIDRGWLDRKLEVIIRGIAAAE
ncbi:TetR/AcrR family transcriptional regulator [Actinomyces ruminicola]|uniref:Transcriptional regulator, TetR family n=1 Tax=Actinomyces ruminicola TaxID=332524 RepID=A0A1G9T4G7_9ACTO|nr:TetR/AcrR family transcriptional regulator [Actinomyces ruminicola]SDM42599.1 transcriptional regulator, TetR family [Actinomyces ruminicola]